MITVRLPEEIEKQLNHYSRATNKTKTQVVKEALRQYFESSDKAGYPNAYMLGETLFGKYGSSENDLSATYKQRLRKKLNEKYATR